MEQKNLEGLLLKSINYKDRDKIYTIFTKEKGKISAKGRGVRAHTSKRAGTLDTLNVLKFGVWGKDDWMYTLKDTSLISSYSEIKKSHEKSKRAYFILFLLLKLTPEHQPYPKIYKKALLTLDKLNTGGIDDYYVLNFFISFLENIGYKLNFKSCVRCHKNYSLKSWKGCSLSFGLGGLMCSDCGVSSLDSNISNALVISSFDESPRIPERLDYKGGVRILSDFVKHELGESLEPVIY